MTSRPVSSKIVGLLGGTAKEKEKKTFSSHIKYVKEHKRHDPDSNLLCKQEKKGEKFFFLLQLQIYQSSYTYEVSGFS